MIETKCIINAGAYLLGHPFRLLAYQKLEIRHHGATPSITWLQKCLLCSTSGHRSAGLVQ